MRRITSKPSLLGLAVFSGMILTGGMVGAAASPSSQEQHDQDYSKNKNYQLGMREGKDDQEHNRDHYKKRHFKKDEDQKAYEYGYQQGHHGDQHDGDQHDHHDQHDH
jgi:hypothetical protein